MSKNIILASTSTTYGGTYLEYLYPQLEELYKDINEIIFIPYARPGGISHNEYTTIVKKTFKKLNKEIVGLHTYYNPIEALKKAKGIFTGGGNTFTLVNALYKNDIMATLREQLLQGVPYLGTSAGSNICGLTMQTTNDMPIVYPPSFKTLGMVPFNINPHYLDPQEGSSHMGETRETRIKEYHQYNTPAVIGLKEGSWIRIIDTKITLEGTETARVFEQSKSPYELAIGAEIVL